MKNLFKYSLISLLFLISANAIGQSVGSPGSTVTVMGELAVKKSDTIRTRPTFIFAAKGDTVVKYNADSLSDPTPAQLTFGYGFIPSFNPYSPNGGDISVVADTTSPDGLATKKELNVITNVDSAQFIVDSIACAPTGTETDGTKYLVCNSPTGEFSAHANDIAVKTAGIWSYTDAANGDQVIVDDPTSYITYQFNGTIWVQTAKLARWGGDRYIGKNAWIGRQDSVSFYLRSFGRTFLYGTPFRTVYMPGYTGDDSSYSNWDGDGQMVLRHFKRIEAGDNITIDNSGSTTIISSTGGDNENIMNSDLTQDADHTQTLGAFSQTWDADDGAGNLSTLHVAGGISELSNYNTNDSSIAFIGAYNGSLYGSNAVPQMVLNKQNPDLSFDISSLSLTHLRGIQYNSQKNSTDSSYFFPVNMPTADDQTMLSHDNGDGTYSMSWADPGIVGWSLTGNSGINESTNFIGTTDNKDVIFKRNNTEAFRLSSFEISAKEQMNFPDAGVGNSIIGAGGFTTNNLGSTLTGTIQPTFTFNANVSTGDAVEMYSVGGNPLGDAFDYPYFAAYEGSFTLDGLPISILSSRGIVFPVLSTADRDATTHLWDGQTIFNVDLPGFQYYYSGAWHDLTSGGGGTVTDVTASSPLSSSGGATPNITIANAAADGSTKGAASFTANDFNASSGNISLDYTNGQAADASHKGFLTSTDWSTFNGKAASGANTDITSILLNQTGLVVKGASSNGLTIKPNETLSAGRTLNIVTGDASRTLTFTGDASISGTNTGDQTSVSGNAGTATTLQTARNIYGNSFDGSASLTQIIASTFGGTGNGFTKFTGPTTSEKTFTLPNSNATLLYDTYTSPTFSTDLTVPKINLSGTSNQLVFQSAGVTGTLSWAPSSSNKTITLPNGTTDFTATGGTSQVVKQTSSGAALTVGQLAASDLSDGTTGSGGAVVLATGPTMTNPVVGTQSASDNSTKAASTAYTTTAVANGRPTMVNPGSNITTTSGTLTNATGYNIALGANKKYNVIGVLNLTTDAAGVGMLFSFTVPSGATLNISFSGTRATTALVGTQVTTSGTSNGLAYANVSGGGTGQVTIVGSVVTSASTGDLQLQWRAQTATNTQTINTGSFFTVEEVQ